MALRGVELGQFQCSPAQLRLLVTSTLLQSHCRTVSRKHLDNAPFRNKGVQFYAQYVGRKWTLVSPWLQRIVFPSRLARLNCGANFRFIVHAGIRLCLTEFPPRAGMGKYRACRSEPLPNRSRGQRDRPKQRRAMEGWKATSASHNSMTPDAAEPIKSSSRYWTRPGVPTFRPDHFVKKEKRTPRPYSGSPGAV